MTISLGIVGLPNVGKSTLFNALTRAQVDASNYPFCTIEPNVGVVPLPDHRLSQLATITQAPSIIPATVSFTDIAGLVQGASKGEGLGNKFLSNIRDTAAIVHVVRCFEDPNITHVSGSVNPTDDIEVIELELILSDLELCMQIREKLQKKAKSNDAAILSTLEVLTICSQCLEDERPLRSLTLNDEDLALLKGFQFLTQKPVIYVMNVSESDLKDGSSHSESIQQIAQRYNDPILTICTQLESELVELPEEDQLALLSEYGLSESGLNALARAGFDALGLQTYLTAGPKEVRAWTIHKQCTAPQAAGVIHTDFETGFIRANVIEFSEFVACNGWKQAKDQGKIRQEGKDYLMRDGDVVEFLFNV